MTEIKVSAAPRVTLIGAFIILIALAAWGVRHVVSMIALFHGRSTEFGVVFSLAFAILAFQTALYYLERPRSVTPEQAAQLDSLYVVVPVPVYNEDPALLRRCLLSLLNQDRRPHLIFVVDDGSVVDGTPVDYRAIRREFEREARAAGIETRWLHTKNQGKRGAQGEVISRTPQADVYVTVDSDAYLVRNAISELLKPLSDPDIQSVAGVVLASNSTKNLLTRFTDLWFVSGQLVDRSSQSTMGAVLVNSGVLAAYRAGLLHDFLPVYLNETFFGRPVEFSDDSMLTIFALTRGKAVQQPSAYALTTMPERLDHHIRQYLRWMRGAFIRSWWRFKYLPLGSYAFWSHLGAWVQMVLSSVVFVYLFAIHPILSRQFSPWLLLVPVLIGYAQALRYLSFRRSDESRASQLLTYAMAPVATLWMYFVLRPIRWYAIATCLKTGWGTRDKIEVTASGDQLPEQQSDDLSYPSMAGVL